MNLDITADSIDVEGMGRDARLNVIIRGVELNSLLDLMDIDDVVAYFQKSDILDIIGKEECCSHFELVECEE